MSSSLSPAWSRALQPDAKSYFPSPLYPNPWTLSEYESLWTTFRSAILAAIPGVLITGPAGGHLASWTIPFSEYETGASLGLLTDHYYRLCGETGCSTPTTSALGGATGINFTGSNDLANGDYAPIQDNEVNVVSVQPEYYGILLGGLAGQGTLYTTTLSAGSSVNASAYAVKTSTGLNVVANNRTTEA